jgi:NADH dehydrogenase [ubiquinone] 1 alpha subcomplex assembly factor 7
VDFAALVQAGRLGGAAVFGPLTQGLFLANIGIVERAEQLMAANPDQGKSILQAIERLIGNDQMGRLFKVLAFAPPLVGGMAGFSP